MMRTDLIQKIESVKTMPELDALRIECARDMEDGDKEKFLATQKAFIKARNRLKRIPLRDRSW